MSFLSSAVAWCADTGSSEHVGISGNLGLRVSCPAALVSHGCMSMLPPVIYKPTFLHQSLGRNDQTGYTHLHNIAKWSAERLPHVCRKTTWDYSVTSILARTA